MPRKQKQSNYHPHADHVKRQKIGSQIIDGSAHNLAMSVKSVLPSLAGGAPIPKKKRTRKQPEAWEFTEDQEPPSDRSEGS